MVSLTASTACRDRHPAPCVKTVKLCDSVVSGLMCGCRYEGTVECMTREEWTAQATSLWNDLIDERGRLKICMDADRRLNTGSIEGAAQATLETVYGPRNLRYSL